jgi:hypothetical protein
LGTTRRAIGESSGVSVGVAFATAGAGDAPVPGVARDVAGVPANEAGALADADVGGALFDLPPQAIVANTHITAASRDSLVRRTLPPWLTGFIK